ncbi:MAG: class I SAM-dependent methyltransferase [Myxococcota bacterium]
MTRSGSDPSGSYDAVSEEYVRRFLSELDHKPFDRELLDRFAERVRELGPVADVGCGPGQIARYLHERGLRMVGLDVSPGMVEQARRLHPSIEFSQGDMRSLDVPAGEWAALVAFYSIIHIPRDEVPAVLRGFRRALRPSGLLLMSFHIGDERIHLDEWWDRPVSLDFFLFQPNEMTGYLREAGFDVEEALERDPYCEDVEAQTRRCYMVARAIE